MKTAILKITGSCNLACDYCYQTDAVPKNMMSLDVLENIIDKAARHAVKNNEPIKVLFHGGEPLLAGVDFFKTVLDLQEKYVLKYEQEYKTEQHLTRFKNGIQTNGTLYTEEYFNFFKGNPHYTHSISLDGPKDIHDHNRPGSFDRVYSNILKLKMFSGEKAIGIIGVVSQHSLGNATRIYDFFKSLDLDVKLNPIFKVGQACNSDEVVSPAEYASHMIELLDLWVADKEGKFQIAPLNTMIGALLTGDPSLCTFNKSCNEYFMAINADGDVVPCSRLDGYEKLVIGNILNMEELIEAYNNSMLTPIKKAEIEECQNCDFKAVCNSGCAAESYISGVPMKHSMCAAYKRIYYHLCTYLNEWTGIKDLLPKNLGFGKKLHKFLVSHKMGTVVRKAFTNRVKMFYSTDSAGDGSCSSWEYHEHHEWSESAHNDQGCGGWEYHEHSDTGSSGDGGACHITKVVLYTLNKDDNCEELTLLRKFRDEYLVPNHFDTEVQDYYANSVNYALMISNSAISNPDIYKIYYNDFIGPAVAAIKVQDYPTVHDILRKYLKTVKNLNQVI